MIKKDRNGWIAVIFLIYIFSIPVRTIAGGDTEEDVIITDEDAVLAGNGTAAERMDTTVDAENVSEGESADVAQTEETETVAERWQETFSRMQSSLNAFTEKLFLRNAFISLNSELTRTLTGGTYMESTQVLLGKEDWLFYKTQNDGYPVYDYMGINHFTEEETHREAASLFHTRIRELTTSQEREQALKETILLVKKNSIDVQTRNLNPTDMAGLQRLMEEKRKLADLKKLHISID